MCFTQALPIPPHYQAEAKRQRRDFRESERLRVMVERQDAAAAAEGGAGP